MIEKDKIYNFTIVVLVVLLYFSFTKRKEVIVEELHTTDTLYVSKTDTIVQLKPTYIYKKVTDTIEVLVKDSISVSLPIESRFYSVPNTYDLWISGYEPKLDSIKTYNKVEYRKIKEVKEKIVYPKNYKLYAGVGFSSISDKIIPNLSISLATPKEWIIDATFGQYDGSMVYSVGVKTKIFGK